MRIVCKPCRQWHAKFCELRILRKRSCLKSSTSCQTQGIDLQLFQLFKKLGALLFHAQNTQLSQNFPEKLIVPSRYLRIGNKPSSLQSHGISKGFNFSCKSKSSRTAYTKAGASLSFETRIFQVSRDHKLALKTFDCVAYSQHEINHASHCFEDLKWLEIDPLFLTKF